MRTNSASAKRVLGTVRNATSALHTELDQTVQRHRVLTGDVDRAHYLQMLKAHWSLHRLVAQHTAASLAADEPSFLDWPHCERLDAVTQGAIDGFAFYKSSWDKASVN